MNRRLIIWAFGIAACAGLVTIAGKTRAGFKTSQAVVISQTSKQANADLGYAHNTANNVERFECSVSTTTLSATVNCFAVNSEGARAACFSSDPDLVAAARGISDDSHVMFHWNDNGACTRITVRQGSLTRPKSP